MKFTGELFNSSTGRSARAMFAGRQRAAFWRTQGFPNLVLGRSVIARNRKLRQFERELAKAKLRTPFAMPEDVAEELGSVSGH